MDYPMSFSLWLKQRRAALDLTGDQLAACIGYSVATLRNLESGRRRPSRQLAERLAVALQIAPEDRPAFLRVARSVPLDPASPATNSRAAPSLADRDLTNLPAPLTPLIGRDTLVASIVHQIHHAQPRLLTFTGPGGVGKTRLALEVATALLADFPDGVWYVPLDTISQPHDVLPAIAQALAIREAHAAALDLHLSHVLSRKHLLLVLDTFEHVVAAAPHLVRLLQAVPKLTILVTSRSVLHVAGEHDLPVPPLDLPSTPAHSLAEVARIPAVQLFVDRAQAVNPHFVLLEELAAPVVAICQQLEGLPLAIELAAAQTKHVALLTLATRLSKRLDALVGRQRDQHPRQHSLRATLDWSYHLLTAAERQLFARLSVFQGGCTEAAIVAIGMDVEMTTIRHLLWSLIDHSLVQINSSPTREPRITMLDMIREYAVMLLAASAEHDTVYQQHADYYVRFSEEAQMHLASAERDVWLARLDEELPNIRSALQWALDRSDGTRAARLMGNLCSFWLNRGYYSETRRWCTDILAVPHSMPDEVRARVINLEGIMANEQADYTYAHACFTAAVTLRRKVGDMVGTAASLNNLGLVAMLQGQYLEAQASYEAALALYRQHTDAWGTALVLGNLGLVALYQDDVESARQLVEESLALRRAHDDQSGIMTALNYLGQVARWCRQWQEAQACFTDSLALSRTMGDQCFTSRNLIELGLIATQLADYAAARVLLVDGLVQSQEIGEREGIVMSIEGLAELEATRGEVVRAVQLLGAAAAFRDGLCTPTPPHHHRTTATILTTIRAQGETATIDAAWWTGQGMTVADIVALTR